MNDFSHIDKAGMPSMVNISEKKVSKRSATARSIVVLPTEIIDKLNEGEIQTKKGPVFQTAIVAGIMAAKRTGELIPLCHPLGLTNCSISLSFNKDHELIIDCTADIEARTGVEMEALVGASMAALTVYDMCKAISNEIVIKEIKLMKKTGGKKDFERK